MIAAHLIKQADYTQQLARTGAVTLIQRLGSALNLNVHVHMLFLGGVYERAPDCTRLRFQWVREPTTAQLTQLAHTIACRVGRLLEREGLLERDTDKLALVGHSITYRIAVGPHWGRNVFTLQTCRQAVGRVGRPTRPAPWPAFHSTLGRSQEYSTCQARAAVPIHLPSYRLGKAVVRYTAR